MKIVYTILFLLSALGAKAGCDMVSSAITPMDSTKKQLKIKSFEKDLSIKNVEELTPVSSEPLGFKKMETAMDAQANAPKSTPKSIPGKSPEKAIEENPETENAGTESKMHFELNDNSNMATFPGGERGVRDFIRKNKTYPNECKATRANGKVVIGMTIAPDGTPGNIHVAVSSGNSHMDDEAMRIAKIMPKWDPAKDIKNGEDRQYRMSMTFRPGR